MQVGRIVPVVQGYDSTSYGDGFADVYDDWYADLTDVDTTVARIVELAGPGGRILELGAGTGRLAVPLAEAGLHVTAIDASDAMLERLRRRGEESGVGDRLVIVRGDMVAELPAGPFDVALVAYNTLFNLVDDGAQQACFHSVAERLGPDGVFVVEASVPDDEVPASADVSLRSMSADRVVLSITDHRPDDRRTWGQFVELSESGGVRLRPWSIRWSAPAELDDMARRAQLERAERYATMAGAPFDDESGTHVTIYRALR